MTIPAGLIGVVLVLGFVAGKFGRRASRGERGFFCHGCDAYRWTHEAVHVHGVGRRCRHCAQEGRRVV